MAKSAHGEPGEGSKSESKVRKATKAAAKVAWVVPAVIASIEMSEVAADNVKPQGSPQ
jgi:hypothetical protein